MPPVGFEPTISAGERPQTARLRPRGYWDRLLGPATGTGYLLLYRQEHTYKSLNSLRKHPRARQLVKHATKLTYDYM